MDQKTDQEKWIKNTDQENASKNSSRTIDRKTDKEKLITKRIKKN